MKFVYIYVTDSRPNSWTEWADIFCGHSGVLGGCFRVKKIKFFLFQIFFLTFKRKKNFLRATPGPSASIIYISFSLIFPSPGLESEAGCE